jgi:hypothetical protein
MFFMDCQQRMTVGGASCACVSQRDSMGLHNVGGRMGEFRLLYLLCMLRFPVPLHSLHGTATGAPWHMALALGHRGHYDSVAHVRSLACMRPWDSLAGSPPAFLPE